MTEVAGSAACFVDPFEISSIRAGILRVLGDPKYRRHLVAAGFENVKRFSPAIIASRYAEAYQEILRLQRQASISDPCGHGLENFAPARSTS
jgi:hypothetical protein